MRFHSGETYIEAVQRKRYKYRKCAWKAASRAGKWFTVKMNGYGRYCVVPMTQDERDRAQRNASINELLHQVYSKSVKEQLETASYLYNQLV